MSYVVQSDLEVACGGSARLVQLTDLDGAGALDADAMNAAIAAAEGWIDGYLRARFKTPIAAPSATLKLAVADEAIYQLRRRRSMLTEQDVADKTARDSWARDVAAGKVRPDEPAPATSTAVRASFRASTRDVSRKTLKGAW